MFKDIDCHEINAPYKRNMLLSEFQLKRIQSYNDIQNIFKKPIAKINGKEYYLSWLVFHEDPKYLDIKNDYKRIHRQGGDLIKEQKKALNNTSKNIAFSVMRFQYKNKGKPIEDDRCIVFFISDVKNKSNLPEIKSTRKNILLKYILKVAFGAVYCEYSEDKQYIPPDCIDGNILINSEEKISPSGKKTEYIGFVPNIHITEEYMLNFTVQQKNYLDDKSTAHEGEITRPGFKKIKSNGKKKKCDFYLDANKNMKARVVTYRKAYLVFEFLLKRIGLYKKNSTMNMEYAFTDFTHINLSLIKNITILYDNIHFNKLNDDEKYYMNVVFNMIKSCDDIKFEILPISDIKDFKSLPKECNYIFINLTHLNPLTDSEDESNDDTNDEKDNAYNVYRMKNGLYEKFAKNTSDILLDADEKYNSDNYKDYDLYTQIKVYNYFNSQNNIKPHITQGWNISLKDAKEVREPKKNGFIYENITYDKTNIINIVFRKCRSELLLKRYAYGYQDINDLLEYALKTNIKSIVVIKNVNKKNNKINYSVQRSMRLHRNDIQSKFKIDEHKNYIVKKGEPGIEDCDIYNQSKNYQGLIYIIDDKYVLRVNSHAITPLLVCPDIKIYDENKNLINEKSYKEVIKKNDLEEETRKFILSKSMNPDEDHIMGHTYLGMNKKDKINFKFSKEDKEINKDGGCAAISFTKKHGFDVLQVYISKGDINLTSGVNMFRMDEVTLCRKQDHELIKINISEYPEIVNFYLHGLNINTLQYEQISKKQILDKICELSIGI